MASGERQGGPWGGGAQAKEGRCAGETGEEGDGCRLLGALSRLWSAGGEQEEAGGGREGRPGLRASEDQV